MEALGSIRGLWDLPGYDHIAEVADDYGEPLSLRGSAARRLLMHLARGRRVDYSLPAVCSPPPSDLDLLFKTEKSKRIAKIVGDIREKAPIFQAMRVEASSTPRIEDLEARLDEYVHCPVLGISLGADAPSGFSDKTGTGMVELVDGNMSFTVDSRANSRRPELRFQCYVSCFVYIKVCIDRVGIDALADQPGFARAIEFAGQQMPFAEDYVRGDETLYALHRLLDIAFSLRSMIGASHYRTLSVLLPPSVNSQINATRRGGSLVRFGKSNPFEPTIDWHLPSPEELGRATGAIDLGSASVFAVGPSLPLSNSDDDGPSFMDAIVPIGGKLKGLPRPQLGAYAAALELNLSAGTRSFKVWLPAFCEGRRWRNSSGTAQLNLRVETTAAAKMASRADKATATIYLLGEPAKA